MKLALLSVLAVSAYATPLIVSDAIPITGSGNWFQSPDGSGSTISAYGSMGNHLVSLSYESCMGSPSGLSASTVGGCTYDMSAFGAMVDNVRSHVFTFYLTGGAGSLQLFDASRNLMASVLLLGDIVETSHNTVSPYESNGTFSIVAPLTPHVVANPEPGTLALMMVAFLCVACPYRLRA